MEIINMRIVTTQIYKVLFKFVLFFFHISHCYVLNLSLLSDWERYLWFYGILKLIKKRTANNSPYCLILICKYILLPIWKFSRNETPNFHQRLRDATFLSVVRISSPSSRRNARPTAAVDGGVRVYYSQFHSGQHFNFNLNSRAADK